jgi:ribosomal-protein-serine acetyltransferase
MQALQLDDNIRLERPAPHHAEEALTVVRENLEHLKPWMPWAVDDYSLDHAKTWIRKSMESEEKDGTFGLVIFFNDKMIGGIGIHNLDSTHRRAELGYWIDHRFQGKGIVMKCCKALIDHCFEKMGLNRVQINCNIENVRSRAIPERLGFTFEGTLRQAELVNGEFRDWAVYGLLADDPRLW